MSPIEISWYIVVVLFGIVGIVRTYPRELGVTTMCVAALLLLLQFGSKTLTWMRSSLSETAPWLMSERFSAGFYIAVFLGIVYISYQGITLIFRGNPPKGPMSTLLSLVVGLVNGYFVSGTVWWYVHASGYPFGMVDATQLSASAQRLVQYLPPKVFEAHPGYLIVLLVLLLVLSVWR
jgi:hypothetical protein